MTARTTSFLLTAVVTLSAGVIGCVSVGRLPALPYTDTYYPNDLSANDYEAIARLAFTDQLKRLEDKGWLNRNNPAFVAAGSADPPESTVHFLQSRWPSVVPISKGQDGPRVLVYVGSIQAYDGQTFVIDAGNNVFAREYMFGYQVQKIDGRWTLVETFHPI